MRTIAVASVVLVAVTAGVTQKAIEAPRPAGVSARSGGLVQQVACVSPKSCAAIGVWLYSDIAGKWEAAKTPVVAHTGGTNLASLDCPAASKCEAVGEGGLQHVVQVSENGRKWKAGEIALPSDAAPVNPPSTEPFPSLRSVSCSSTGNCVAVGNYRAANRTTRPLLVTESGGTWGAGSEPQLPGNADTSPDPNQPGVGGGLSLVSCPAAGECTAVGSYTNSDAGHSYYPWVATQSGGAWSAGAEALLPADAAVQGDLEKSGTAPFFGFTGLSCPAAGNCIAVGGYEDKNGAEQGLILTEHDGVWSRGVKAPAEGTPNEESNEFNSPLVSVSCSAPDDCAAIGWYVLRTSGTYHGLLLRERSGKWTASALTLPAKAKAPGGVFLTSVSCPSRGNCVAAGVYGGGGKTHGLFVRERGGKWSRALDAALPKGASASGKSHSLLYSVSCPSASACMAGGYYAGFHKVQGLLLSLRLR